MHDLAKRTLKLPPEQQAIRAKCFHPSRTFVEFPIHEVEQSIPELSENTVRFYPNRLVVRAFCMNEAG